MNGPFSEMTFSNMRPIGPVFMDKNADYKRIQGHFSRPGKFTVLTRNHISPKLLPEEIHNLKDLSKDKEGFVFIDDNIIQTLHLDFKKPDDVLLDVILISRHCPPTVVTIVEDTGDVAKTVIRYNKRIAGRLILSMLHFTGENMTTLCTILKKSDLTNVKQLRDNLDEAKKLGAETRTPDEMYMNETKRNGAKLATIGVLAFSNDEYSLYKTFEEEKELFSLSFVDFMEIYMDKSYIGSI